MRARGRRLGVQGDWRPPGGQTYAVGRVQPRLQDYKTDIEQFTDAELTAILRSRVKIVPVETTDEERPEGEPLN